MFTFAQREKQNLFVFLVPDADTFHLAQMDCTGLSGVTSNTFCLFRPLQTAVWQEHKCNADRHTRKMYKTKPTFTHKHKWFWECYWL